MVAKELQDTLRDITILGYGLILICHSKEKATQYTDADGNAIVSVEPDLSKNIYGVCSAICDLIAYIGIEFDADGVGRRWLYTRQTPTVFAGSRWKYLEPRIQFGYNELVDGIGEAIKKQKELDGATVVDKVEKIQIEERSFSEIMEETKQVWQDYFEKATDEEEREQRYNIMRDIIGKIFGSPDFKLSSAVPSQIDLVQLFIAEVKDTI